MAYCIRRVRSRFEQELYVPFMKKIEQDERVIRQDIAQGRLYLLEENGKGVCIALVTHHPGEICELRNIRSIEHAGSEQYERTLIRFLMAVHQQDFKRMVIRMRLSMELNTLMLNHLGFVHVQFDTNEKNPIVYERTFD